MKKRFIELWNTYERPLAAFTLVCGFTFDLFLAKRPDSIADNILLLFYLTISATIIVLLNRRSKREKEGERPVEPLLLLLILQFCFGGLASNLLILYGKSGSFSGSVIFILLLIALLIGNEFLKSRYGQLRFNIAVYYVLLLTYSVIAMPTFVLHTVDTGTFLASSITSLIVMAIFLGILFPSMWRGKFTRPLLGLGLLVLTIFVIFNGLYFLNVIPPVPLSLKAAGIYHSVARDGQGNFMVTYEKKQWYEFWRDTSDTYTVEAGQPAYCFSAVFAPGDLSTPIVHKWEYFYPDTKKWLAINTIEFPINGGRAEGYRGFTQKRVLTDGQWRCTVETSNGQVIGYITFNVVTASTTPTLSTATL